MDGFIDGAKEDAIVGLRVGNEVGNVLSEVLGFADGRRLGMSEGEIDGT